MAADDPNMASMAGRYASALYELATESGQADAVESDLKRVQGLLDGSADLRRLVRSPVFASDDQGRALAAVMARAGIGGLTANFLQVIVRNRRLFALADMIKAYLAIAARARGEVGAEVASAIPLSDAHVSALKEALKAAVGKDVQLTTRVDPGLLGGLVVKIGSRMIDSSLRTKLNSLKTRMKEAN